MAYSPPIDAGSCSYNGWDFSLFSKTTVTVKPVLDSAKRTLSYNEHLVEVEDIIVPQSGESDVEDLVSTARRLLTARGGQLTISGKAYALDVNNPSGKVRDVANGPVCEVVELRPIGSRMAWQLRWRCTVHIPECSQARYSGISEFTHSWNVSIDEDGYTVRSISGRLVIALTTLASGGAGRRRPPDDADAYFERVVAALPPVENFRRSTTRNMSPDRRTLDFSIVDREMEPSAFLPGITQWTGSQEVHRDSSAWFRHTVSFRGDYTLAKGAAKTVAVTHFVQLVKSRQARLSRDDWPLPLELTVRDELHSRKVSLIYRMLFASNADPQKALEQAGMWLPVPDASWPAWARSMRASVLHARGSARIYFNREQDLLIDLCDSDRLGTQGARSLSAAFGGGRVAELHATPPPANRSWIFYEGILQALADDGVTVLRTLPLASLENPAAGTRARDLVAAPPEGSQLQRRTGDSTDLRNTGAHLVNARGSNVTVPPRGDNTVHLQRRTGPLVRVRLVGRAIRWGWPIAPPRLLGALGAQATLENPVLMQKVGSLISGVPLVGCSWADTYVLQGARSGLLPFAPSLE
jgi:hypothetical protein